MRARELSDSVLFVETRLAWTPPVLMSTCVLFPMSSFHTEFLATNLFLKPGDNRVFVMMYLAFVRGMDRDAFLFNRWANEDH